MKKILITGILLLSFIGITRAANAQAPPDQPPPSSPVYREPMFTAIDEVEVPLEILFKIQLVYQGYAVNHASKMVHDGKPGYRLWIDRDSASSSREHLYLLYDADWQFIKEDRSTPPPPPAPAAPPPPPAPSESQPAQDSNRGNRERIIETDEPDEDEAETDKPPRQRGGDRSDSGDGSTDSDSTSG